MENSFNKLQDVIDEDSNRDYWMSAEEAVLYGIVDGKLERM